MNQSTRSLQKSPLPEVYGVAPGILFIPILIFSVAACAAMLERTGRLSIPMAWSLVCILLVVTPRLLAPWLFWESYFVSASYLISLGLFLLGFPLLFKFRLVVSDLFSVFLLAALISEAKVSVGLLFAGLWLMRWLFIRGERPAFERIAALSALVAAAFVMSGAIGAMGGWVMIGPHNIPRLLLNFVHVFPFGDVWISAVIEAIRAGTDVPWRVAALASLVTLSFLVFHFLFSWLLIGRAIYNQGITALLQEPIALYSLATVISGALIVFLFW